jgi:TRAP-type C4-dicarboxylate transport system permease large subunit
VHFGIIYPRRGGRLESILVFYIPMVIVLFLVTYIPALSLWLPHLVLD